MTTTYTDQPTTQVLVTRSACFGLLRKGDILPAATYVTGLVRVWLSDGQTLTLEGNDANAVQVIAP